MTDMILKMNEIITEAILKKIKNFKIDDLNNFAMLLNIDILNLNPDGKYTKKALILNNIEYAIKTYANDELIEKIKYSDYFNEHFHETLSPFLIILLFIYRDLLKMSLS